MTSPKLKKLQSFLAAILVVSFLLTFLWLAEDNWKSLLNHSSVPKSSRSKEFSASATNSETNGSSNPESVELPNWLNSYSLQHRHQRRRYDKERANDVKFLVVACIRRTQCGGLSDRVRSIPYWLVLAEKTDRVLLIHWNKKFKLEDFWIPPDNGALLDWTLPEEWKRQSPFQHSCLQKPTRVLPEFHDESNHEAILSALDSSERVVCVKTRADLVHLVYDSFARSTDSASARQVMSRVFQLLFTNTESLQAYIDRIKVESIGLDAKSPYLAAHIRALYPLKTDSGLFWPNWGEHSAMIKRWAEKAVDSVIDAYKSQFSSTDVSVPPIYVASDAAEVVDYLLNRNTNWPTHILGLQRSLPRYHLELDIMNNSAHDMFPTFLDVSMLSHAKCLSFGIGSYGKLSARISGLQCIAQHRTSQYLKDNNSPVVVTKAAEVPTAEISSEDKHS